MKRRTSQSSRLVLHFRQRLHLHGRVAHDLQELLVRPDIGFEGRYVEIAKQNGMAAAVQARQQPGT